MKRDLPKDDAFFLIIIRYVFKWRWYIGACTLITGIISVIATMPSIMRPKFESTVVFYPTSTNSISKALLASDPSSKLDLLAFGEEEEAEQLLQILESDRIRNIIIEKYNLKKRYRIKDDEEFSSTLLSKMYQSNVKFGRNQHMAIEVNVLDENPDTAAMIANDIANLMDSVKSKIQKERAIEGLIIVEEEYRKKENAIKQIEDSLATLGEMGIVNYKEQATTISEALDKARTDYYNQKANYEQSPTSSNKKKLLANEERLVEIKDEFKKLGKYGSIWLSLSEGLVLELEQFKLLKEKYEQAKVDAARQLSHKFVINAATPAEKKAWPLRSLILLISCSAAFVLSTVLFILYENIIKYKDFLTGK